MGTWRPERSKISKKTRKELKTQVTEAGADQCMRYPEQEFSGNMRDAPAGKPGVFPANSSYYSDRR